MSKGRLLTVQECKRHHLLYTHVIRVIESVCYESIEVFIKLFLFAFFLQSYCMLENNRDISGQQKKDKLLENSSPNLNNLEFLQ